jgi:hydrogenase maturation protease
LAQEKSILILGVGNLLLTDEGVGVHVAHRLMEMALPPHVEVLDGGTSGFDLLDAIEGRQKVIVVDAVQAGQPPGTLYRFTRKDIEERPKQRLSVHDIDMTDLLRLSDLLGVEKPVEVVVYGVEAKDITSASMELSAEVEARVPRLIEYVMQEIGDAAGECIVSSE